MKQKDVFAVKVLRFLKSNLDAVAKDNLAELSDEEVVAIIQKRIKQSTDAEGKYMAGQRQDLAATERKEIDLISGYLPPQLPKEEIENIVKKIIAKMGASSMKDFGRVMGAAMKAVGGRAGGSAVKTTVEKELKSAA